MSQIDDFVAAVASDRTLRNQLKTHVAEGLVATASEAGYTFTTEDALSYFAQHRLDMETLLDGAYSNG